jgi:hypothetical protein
MEYLWSLVYLLSSEFNISGNMKGIEQVLSLKVVSTFQQFHNTIEFDEEII